MTKGIDILQFINALRESDEYIKTIFLNGSCYKFYILLKKFFPECKPFISEERNHIVTYCKGKHYDVTGEVSGNGFVNMFPEDIDVAEKWSFRNHNYLLLGECPVCGELLVYTE